MPICGTCYVEIASICRCKLADEMTPDFTSVNPLEIRSNFNVKEWIPIGIVPHETTGLRTQFCQPSRLVTGVDSTGNRLEFLGVRFAAWTRQDSAD